MRVPPQVTGVHSSYGRGWMKTTTHKIWRCRKWLVCTDTNIPFSSVIYISSVTSQEKKDGICSSSSEPLSCMGINSKGEWQRFSFFVKYPAEFLLYFFSTNLSASEAVEGRICISWPCYYWLLSPFSSLRALWYFPSVADNKPQSLWSLWQKNCLTAGLAPSSAKNALENWWLHYQFFSDFCGLLPVWI